jgi:hypothetical protein
MVCSICTTNPRAEATRPGDPAPLAVRLQPAACKRTILWDIYYSISVGWEEFAELWDIQAAMIGYALGVPNSERQHLNNCIAKEKRSWQPE